MIRFGLYFCFSDEDLKLEKPYSQGPYLGWYWLFPALTKPKGWLRSDIQPLLPSHRSGALERDWISLEGHFFYLPKVTIWSHTRLPKGVSKSLWQLLTRAWWSTCPILWATELHESTGKGQYADVQRQKTKYLIALFLFLLPSWKLLFIYISTSRTQALPSLKNWGL